MALRARVARFDNAPERDEQRLGRLEFVGELLQLEKRTHAREEFFRIDGLAEEVVGAGFDSLEAVLAGGQAGDHHDWDEPRERIILQLAA